LLGSEKTAALYGSGQIHEENLGSINEENLGSIQFSLEYDADTSILTLELNHASDLSSPDSGTSAATLPDPYVTVRLLPDAGNRLQTRVHRRTQCPLIDEKFLFDVAWSQLAARSLEMRVYHDNGDDARRDDCIGQVLLALDQLDLSTKCVLCKGISTDDKQVSLSLSLSPSHTFILYWWRGVVVSVVRRMNEVTLRRARLVLGWVTVFGRVYAHGQFSCIRQEAPMCICNYNGSLTHPSLSCKQHLVGCSGAERVIVHHRAKFWSRSVEPLARHGDFSVVKMAPVRRVGFFKKSKFLQSTGYTLPVYTPPNKRQKMPCTRVNAAGFTGRIYGCSVHTNRDHGR